ncbi:MAG: flagellar hook capping protein [Thermaerobacter sp.]|jgi:flagellar basal-body rod modification protein FlgD|nr:flagellar hook capping protein [Thermaerobacter sp.]MDA8146730.1 flagellar hook capping protein [Thermaerobacter sp.]
MSSINPLGSGSGTGSSGIGPLSSASPQQLQNQFLQLLAAELQYQNPSQPVNSTQFIAQLAQFSTMQQIAQLSQQFSGLTQAQSLATGAQLLGKAVTYQDAATGAVASGTVTGVSVSSGQVQLDVGGQQVSLSQLQEVSS